jgi:hypothetical protein
MPSMKAGYRRSVSRGSGSSRKYSFRVPAMALMSMSLNITRMSLLSVEGREGGGEKTKTHMSSREAHQPQPNNYFISRLIILAPEMT